MPNYLLALDQGTSSSRALLFDHAAQLIASHALPLHCEYPQPGWVQQDALQLWTTQRDAVQGVMQKAGVSARDIAALGITNQRETVIAWHRDTGEPAGPAIVWQCRRTDAYCTQLKARGVEDDVRQRTGLVIDPYFSASKMQWMLQHYPKAKSWADQDKLCFGTVDSWLIWQLTGGRHHLTDASNASRTQLYHLLTGEWDAYLLNLFTIPRACLPNIVDSSAVVAETDASLFGHAIPIAGIAGDQQAALFGQGCFEAGMTKNTYGTGCFMLMQTGAQLRRSTQGLLTTIAWQINGQREYALEGSVFVAGALIQWLRDELQVIRHSNECEALATSVNDNGGVYIVPAFVGLGAPHWRSDARGLICGLTRGSTRAHIVRAALEAVAYQTADVLRAMESDAGLKLRELRIDGGMTANAFLCQFQAELLHCAVKRPQVIESTARGAALLAGLGVGLWSSREQLSRLWQCEREFRAQLPPERVTQWRQGWDKAVARALL